MHQNQLPLRAPAARPGRLPGGPLLGLERSFHGELDEIVPLIPEFDRVPFGAGAGGENAAAPMKWPHGKIVERLRGV